MYTFLIAEDDRRIRLLLSRILQKNFDCEILETENGMEALRVLQNQKPDILFLDVEMPVMNGFDTLNAIRSDPNNSNTTVIILSAANEKSTVAQLVSLGIDDFILKPFNFENAVDRISKVIAKKYSFVERINESLSFSGAVRKKILLIEKDPQFRSFFLTTFESIFEVRAADSGIEGLKLFLDFQADVVIIGEYLTSLNEKLLAYKLKELAEGVKPKIYYLSASNSPLPSHIFSGVLKKTKEYKIFYPNFMRTVFSGMNDLDMIRNIISDDFGDEYFSVLKQIFLVMAGEDIAECEAPDFSESLISRAFIKFCTADKKVVITLYLCSMKDFFSSLANKIKGSEIQDGEPANKYISELMLILAGRLRTYLGSLGVHLLEHEEVSFDEIKAEKPEGTIDVCFNSGDEVFFSIVTAENL